MQEYKFVRKKDKKQLRRIEFTRIFWMVCNQSEIYIVVSSLSKFDSLNKYENDFVNIYNTDKLSRIINRLNYGKT